MNIYLKHLKLYSKNEHYFNRYVKFIESRSNRILPENTYKESHHIFPKAFGEYNEDKNLINLTPREHFIAHLLLWKSTNSQKMLYALALFSFGKEYINSKYVDKLRKQHSKNVSQLMKNTVTVKNKNGKCFRVKLDNPLYICGELIHASTGNSFNHSEEAKKKISNATSGKNNPMYGKRHNKESRKKMSIAKKNMSDETKIKIGNASRGRKWSQKAKDKNKDMNKGKNNPMFGVKSPAKGKCWYCHKNKKSTLMHPHDPIIKEEGWIKGRIFKK